LGCGEHVDPIVFDAVVQCVSNDIITKALFGTISNIEKITSDEAADSFPQINFGNILAQEIRKYLMLVNNYVRLLSGYSSKSKDKLIRALKDCLAMTYGKNFPWYNHGIDYTIKHGI